MLFPITIFPCVPFASGIFLISQSAETESSCPRAFVSTDDPSLPPVSRDPRKVRPLSGHSFIVQDMTVCAGLSTRRTPHSPAHSAHSAHSPQPQSLRAPGSMSNGMCSPALISTFGKGDTRSQVVFRVFISRYQELERYPYGIRDGDSPSEGLIQTVG